MSVSAETYIVISLMFAVFAAVAAVGTSVVLGAGFERLRAGFDQVMRQSGFFADAIHKLDQRTQKLDEETAKLRSGANAMGDRMERVEKQTTFIGEAINSLEQRILQGSPSQPQPAKTIRMHPVHTVSRQPVELQQPQRQPEKPLMRENGWVTPPPASEQANAQPRMEERPLIAGMFQGYDDRPSNNMTSDGFDGGGHEREQIPDNARLTSLLSRYLTGEQSGGAKGIVYH